MLKADSPALILIVDDEPGTIRLLSQILQGVGDIIFATNGEDALSMIRERQPDLVLLDAEMAGMSGYEVCETIKRDPIFADLPILFVTAHTSIESEMRALGLGAVDFITKPPSPPIVKARVKTHLMLKQRTDQLHRLAMIDGLTGISNRRAFDAALEEEWRRACRTKIPLSLVLIDVDHFKRFNDHYGHQAGDDCLRAVANALAHCINRPGEMVARYGGEEFAVIVPSCDAENACKLAEKMRTAVEGLGLPHVASDTSAVVTISLGVTSLRLEAPVKDLIAAADAALYQAKSSGRNRAALAGSAS